MALKESELRRQIHSRNASVRSIQVAFRCFLARRLYKSLLAGISGASASEECNNAQDQSHQSGPEIQAKELQEHETHNNFANGISPPSMENCNIVIVENDTKRADTFNQLVEVAEEAMRSQPVGIEWSSMSPEMLIQEIDQRLKVRTYLLYQTSFV